MNTFSKPPAAARCRSAPAPAAVIRVYYADIRALMDLPGTALLTPARRSRMLQYRKAEDKARCLAAGLLVRRHIGLGEPLCGEYGKPYFPSGTHFNVSHSGHYVILAAADQPVGADIEQHGTWDPRVANRVFQPQERSWLQAAEDPDRAFYALWTAKESIMKCEGAGFHMPPITITIDVGRAAGADVSGRIWQLCWRALPEHTICIACTGLRREVVLSPDSREDLLDECV